MAFKGRRSTEPKDSRQPTKYEGPEKVGALWKPKNKDSKMTASGVLQLEGRDGETIRIFILPNKNKTNPKGPDFNIFLSSDDDQAGDPNRGQGPPPTDDGGIPF